MVELENTLVTTLSDHLVLETVCWRHQLLSKRRFNSTCNVIISVLNGFHPSIQFTYESKNRHHFQMYSLFVKDKVLRHVFTGNLQTQTFMFTGTFCINPAETQHSKNFSLSCSYLICSNGHYLTLELKYLRKVFKEYNKHPHWFITQVFNDVDKIFNQ